MFTNIALVFPIPIRLGSKILKVCVTPCIFSLEKGPIMLFLSNKMFRNSICVNGLIFIIIEVMFPCFNMQCFRWMSTARMRSLMHAVRLYFLGKLSICADMISLVSECL